MNKKILLLCVLVTLSSASFLRCKLAIDCETQDTSDARGPVEYGMYIEAPTVTIKEVNCEEKHCGN